MAPSVLDTPITTEEFHSFHGIDRRLYSRIVNDLGQHPIKAIQVMGFWLWIEQCGYPNIIVKMLSLRDGILSVIIDEATAVLQCLSSDVPPHPALSGMPFTQELTEGNRISLSVFYEIRVDAMTGIALKVQNVCVRAFEDIAIQALVNEEISRGGFPPVPPHQRVPLSGVWSDSPVPFYGQGSGFPCGPFLPAFVGGATPSPQMERGESSGSAYVNPRTSTDEVPPEDRTMFLTFSRGYPISEDEVNSFFKRRFGDCIESIIMQEVPPNTQPLFARLVFYSAAKIGEVLNGQEKVKFSIFGKHVWARQFVARDI